MRAGTGARKPEDAEVRVGMISLGCAKNLVDGEVMLGHLERAGATLTADAQAADIVVVNTCGFVTDAKRESIEAILEVARAKRSRQVRRLVVAGCMAQAYAEALRREIPEIDAFVGLDELEEVVAAVRGERGDRLPDQRGALRLYDHHHPRVLSTASYAYLKIAEGCNNPCSFCHIPAMRGAFRSRAPGDLLAEAVALERQGVREVVLIAQDTTRYGEDRGMAHGLRELLSQLLERTSIPWIRFLYAYPATLDQGVFGLMASEPRLVPYLDLPLQHASRRVLKAMRRGGDASSYLRLISEARAAVPEIALRTTFIVGFPGEGEQEFAELMRFAETVRFDHLGVFAYSWQEENPGAALGDPIPDPVKQRRRAELLELQQGISLANNRRLIGRTLPALVAGPLAEMELLTEARLARQAPSIDGSLLINDGAAAPGSLVEVTVTEAHPYDLVGRLEKVLRPAGGARAASLPVCG